MESQIQADHKGQYGLCIFNTESKSDEELEEIFSKFGDLARFHRSKQNILFINYYSAEEAVACIKAFENSDSIKVKPARTKNQNSSQSMRHSSDVETQDFHQRNFGGGGDGFRPRAEISKPKHPLVPKFVEQPELEEKEVTLKGVIIGNLNKNMTQNDVRKLCETSGATPYHIVLKNFKKHQYRKIYYAIVYVMTDKEVENLLLLKGLVLSGHQIITNTVEGAKARGREIPD